MRARLLDATVSSLVEVGYAATTTLEVQKRAGVPRGTLQHHFPTRADLLAGAVEHVALRRIAQLEAEFAALPDGADRLGRAVDMTARMLSGGSFLAALEMWVAARTDPELRAAFLPLEVTLFEQMQTRVREAFRAEFPDDPRVPILTEFTIEIVTGLAMKAMLAGDDAGNRKILDRWVTAVRVLLGTADPAALAPRRRAAQS